MSKEDTNSIKYILEEMDPAEEIEFERRMSSNPDLRIEVESIRRMKGKLNSLPELSPPQDLTDSILSEAANRSKKKQTIRSGYFLSAAVVLLGLTTGSLIIYNISDSIESASNASVSFPSYGNEMIQQDETQTANLKPWVDRQDVLRLSGFESMSNPIMNDEAENRFEKLRPVGEYPDLQPFSRSVQLTGSNQ
jgi:anti-sigma factor RsiW